MVKTSTRTPEEVDRSETPTPAVAAAIAVIIAETSQSQNTLSKEKWKTVRFPNSLLLKQGTNSLNFKKLYDDFPVFCTDKNYYGLDETLHTGHDQVEVDFMPACPNAMLWSYILQIQAATVADEAALVKGSLTERITTYELVNKIIVNDANLQK